jgi:hypothetical protein
MDDSVSPSDAPLLASLDRKLAPVRDRTRSVARGFTTGFYLWGEGGISKSYTVEETLKSLGTAYRLCNTRVTRNLDLRLLVNTFQDRMQYEAGQAEVHWTDLLECRMQGRAVPPTRPLTRVGQERSLVLSIAHLPRPERLARWQAETGKSQASMYRVLNAVSQDSHMRN